MNCEEIMRNLLLNQNGLYRIKWPLAILVSVIAINVLLNSKTKIESWYIYVIALIVSFIVILLCNIFANASVSSSELANLVRKCTNCNLDQTGKMENFENMEEEQVSDEINSMEENKNTMQLDMEDNQEERRIATEEMPQELNNDAIIPTNEEEMMESFQNQTIDDRMFHGTNSPIGDSYPSKQMSYAPLTPVQQHKQDSSKCLLGRDGCMPLCSGYTQNPCNIVSPVPGPTWQVQSAATVQNRLMNRQYVPSKCPIGPQVLRRAPDCKNVGFNDSRGPQQVTCQAVQHPPVYNVQ